MAEKRGTSVRRWPGRAWNTLDRASPTRRSMSIKTSVELQNSGTADESNAENIETNLALSELIDQHENIDWSKVLGISAAEPGAWTARLIKAQETVQVES